MRSNPATLVNTKILRGNKTVVSKNVVNKTGANKAVIASALAAGQSCPQCGGSGMLRLSDQRYRTCLECLGQGKVSRLSGAITAADLLQGQLPKERTQQLPRQSAPMPQIEVNAVGFSSGAK